MTRSILDSWSLGPSEVVAVVGAGGKSTFLEALAQAYEAEGSRVVLTTTTKIRSPAAGTRPLVLAEDLDQLLGLVGRRPSVSPVVGLRLLEDGKMEGIPVDWIPALRDLPWADAVLVEADGAAGRPVKAPAPYEPVIPPCASLVVAMAGLDAQGVPLDAAHVHRPEAVARLLAPDLATLAPRGRLSPAALLPLALVGCRTAPLIARCIGLLTKADRWPPHESLVEAAAAGPAEMWTWSAPSASLECLHRPTPKAAALVLAAGRGTRMEGPKLLADVGGRSVLERTVQAVTEAGAFDPVIVVVGGEVAGTAVADLASGHPDLTVVVNPHPEEGMALSLRLGVGALERARPLAVILADQPFVGVATLTRLLDAAAAHPRAAAVALAGPRGPVPPVVLHPALLPQLLELRGDRGARELLGRYRASVLTLPATPEELLDLDTATDRDRARTIAAERDGGADGGEGSEGDGQAADPPSAGA